MLLKNQTAFGRHSWVKSQTLQFELSDRANFPKCWHWVSPPDPIPASPGAASCSAVCGCQEQSQLPPLGAGVTARISHTALLGSLGTLPAPAPLLSFKPPCWGAVLKSHQVSLAMHWIQGVELIPTFQLERRTMRQELSLAPGSKVKGLIY